MNLKAFKGLETRLHQEQCQYTDAEFAKSSDHEEEYTLEKETIYQFNLFQDFSSGDLKIDMP